MGVGGCKKCCGDAWRHGGAATATQYMQSISLFSFLFFFIPLSFSSVQGSFFPSIAKKKKSGSDRGSGEYVRMIWGIWGVTKRNQVAVKISPG